MEVASREAVLDADKCWTKRSFRSKVCGLDLALCCEQGIRVVKRISILAKVIRMLHEINKKQGMEISPRAQRNNAESLPEVSHSFILLWIYSLRYSLHSFIHSLKY